MIAGWRSSGVLPGDLWRGQVFARSPAAMAINAADGRFIDINDSALALFELSRAEVLGRTSIELGLVRRTTSEQQAFAERVRQGGPARAEERTLHLRSGRTRCISLMVDVLEGEGDRCFLSTFLDVTEQRQAASELRRSQERLEEAQALAHIGSWEWDLRTDRVTRSPEMCRIFGLTHEEFGSSPSSSFERVHPDDRQRLAAAIDVARREGTPWEIEYRIVRPDGVRYLHTRGQMVVDDHGQVVRSFGTAQDITERHLTETRMAHADRMAALGTLAAGAAHEVNNPLTTVIANLDLIRQELAPAGGGASGPAAGDILAMLRDAREAAERVGKIIGDLTVFSRAAQPRAPVALPAVLDAATEAAMEHIRGRARLEKDYLGVPEVDADESGLYRVFLNLLMNSAQAIPAGDPEGQRIRVTARVAGGNRVLVEVSDTGRGIPPALLSRVFDPFFTTGEVGAGSGLGLTVCHGIVQGLGGEITVESTLGRGTTVRVLLPAVRASAGTGTDQVHTPGEGRVLVVDDEVQVSNVVARILRDYRVTVAHGAREALGYLTAGQSFDVILCDVLMPEMTGIDLHARLTRDDPAAAERMIFMTGGTFSHLEDAYLSRVANPTVAKPFSSEQLRALIQRRLSR